MSNRRKGPRKATGDSLESAALSYLRRYGASVAALRRVLMRRVERSARTHGTDRDAGAELVETIIARHLRAGSLDDRRFADGRAAGLHARGISQQGIRYRLRAQGVDSAVIEAALRELADIHSDPDLGAAARYVRRRRFGPYRPTGDRAERRDRDLAAMARAGFDYATAIRVIDAESPEELSDLGHQ